VERSGGRCRTRRLYRTDRQPASRIAHVCDDAPAIHDALNAILDAAVAAAASAILTLRAADGSDTPLFDFAYPQGTEPGEYRFTPGFNFVFAPGWADVTPFALHRSDQFRPAPPYRIARKKYADDYNEAKDVGGDAVTTPPGQQTIDTARDGAQDDSNLRRRVGTQL
jgi:hypothetical protein